MSNVLNKLLGCETVDDEHLKNPPVEVWDNIDTMIHDMIHTTHLDKQTLSGYYIQSEDLLEWNIYVDDILVHTQRFACPPIERTKINFHKPWRGHKFTMEVIEAINFKGGSLVWELFRSKEPLANGRWMADEWD